MREAEAILKAIPQGEGSTLDSDTIDGLHAAEIIAKAVAEVVAKVSAKLRVGGGGGGIAGHVADASAHHAKYTDAEAVAAVEAEAGLTFTGGLELGGDLDLVGNDFLTTNLRIRERTTNAFEITARATATWKHLYLNTLYLSQITSNVTTGNFNTQTGATSKFNFRGHTGAAYAVTASIINTATPNFEILLGGGITQLADKKFVVQESSELTISGGVITVTGRNNVVDTEGDAANDDLDTINGGENGMIITLRAADSARTVTVKHLTVPAGNIQCGTDFGLDNEADRITLQYCAKYSVWVCLNRRNNA